MLVELGNHEMTFAGITYLAEIKARIFDLGVVSLIIKQELKYIDGKIANLSVYVPKAIIENGMEYLLGSMNKNLAKTPISFIFLKDCSEKITVSIQE